MAFLNVPPVLAHIQSGKLRALAVANATRSERLPEVPTMAEAGYAEFEMSTWYGISAPAGTPRYVVDKLYAAIANTLKSPSVREKLALQGAEILLKGPDEFTVYVNADAKRMLQLIQSAGMTAQ